MVHFINNKLKGSQFNFDITTILSAINIDNLVTYFTDNYRPLRNMVVTNNIGLLNATKNAFIQNNNAIPKLIATIVNKPIDTYNIVSSNKKAPRHDNVTYHSELLEG